MDLWRSCRKMSSVNFSDHALASLTSRRAPPSTAISAIDRARSHYLCEPPLPVRQHASSRENDTLPWHISAHFFLSRAARGRWNKQGAEGHPHRARAPRRQPEACLRAADPRYVYSAQSTASLRVEHSPHLQHGRLKSYLIHAVCTHDTGRGVHFVPSMWLPMGTTYVWLGDVHCNSSGCI